MCVCVCVCVTVNVWQIAMNVWDSECDSHEELSCKFSSVISSGHSATCSGLSDQGTGVVRKGYKNGEE